jgi:hypothetical protein
MCFKWHHAVAAGFFVIIAIVFQANAFENEPNPRDGHIAISLSVTDKLLSINARQIGDSSNQFELEPGIRLSVEYENSNLAAIFINIGDQYVNPFTEKEQARRAATDSSFNLNIEN